MLSEFGLGSERIVAGATGWLLYARLGVEADELRRFAFGLFTLDELRRDIARFAFLLGGPCLAADTEEDEW